MSHTIRLKLSEGNEFDAGQTLDCGQAFRFKETSDGSYEGVAGNHPCRIKSDNGYINIECECGGDCESFWENYFDLQRDYGEIKHRLSNDPILKRAVEYCPGIRVLRQDPWETLCSFIISQNNNISRIKLIIERLCENFGDEISDGIYSFPSAERLAGKSREDLSVLKAGFRDKYILDAAGKVADGTIILSDLYEKEISEARKTLMQIKGVGPKVADCVLLFGFSRVECFPQDVWIKRALAQLYPNGFPEEYAHECGIAQQYLFHYCRTSGEAFKELGVLE